MSVLQIAAGVGLAAAGWVMPRVVARAMPRRTWSLALDLLPAVAFFAFFAALTARPLFAGAVTGALLGGFAFTDWIKRDTLREPAVFSDIGELVELFRHPRLYLPFAGPGRVIAGALATFAAFAVLLIVEPAAWAWSWWSAILVPAALVVTGLLVHGPYLAASARVLRRLGPSGEPFADATTLGPLAMQLTYSLIARDERAARRGFANRRAPALIGRATIEQPVFVVQCESFFDARRLHRAIPESILPSYAAACRDGLHYGRLGVPAWGANTMRAEFALMTGLDDAALGFDRFNPYFAFARAPLASLARQMKARGYRTICVHPFDRTFYRRDQVMLNLGFDVFLGEEAFGGAPRANGYITDTAVAAMMLDLLRDEGKRLFLFAITMENHGPWDNAAAPAIDLPELAAIPEAAALGRYLAGIRSGDAMLGMLTSGLGASGDPAVCAFYGDHLPSLPKAFDACGFGDISSDYVLWQTDARAGLRRDLKAHELSRAIFEAQAGIATPTRAALA
jgi:hypothetical protein